MLPTSASQVSSTALPDSSSGQRIIASTVQPALSSSPIPEFTWRHSHPCCQYNIVVGLNQSRSGLGIQSLPCDVFVSSSCPAESSAGGCLDWSSAVRYGSGLRKVRKREGKVRRRRGRRLLMCDYFFLAAFFTGFFAAAFFVAMSTSPPLDVKM